MNYESAKDYLSRIGQGHLLDYYGGLSGKERELLLNDIENTNFSIVDEIGKSRIKKPESIEPPANAVSLNDIARRHLQYKEVGVKFLSEGRVAAVLLAGGQGTRLGFDKPKGMFNIGETKVLSIFEQLMNNLKAVTSLTGRYATLFIMTSDVNDKDTREFFKSNNYFGYPADRIHFFIQKMEPTCSFDGKVFLSEKHRISLSPNGNGGWYSSLIESGLGAVIEREGIEWINVFGVDNVLQRICDPVFIGATVLSSCKCAAKVVKKTCPEERVGVLCEQGGKPAIVEYYEMPPELAAKKAPDGGLAYRYGVILNYLFGVSELNTTLSDKLPYHLAKKAIPHMENGLLVQPDAPCGYKFETLVVDMVKTTGSCLAFEVEREREFAPVKNRSGVDSVDTARELLKSNGVKL